MEWNWAFSLWGFIVGTYFGVIVFGILLLAGGSTPQSIEEQGKETWAYITPRQWALCTLLLAVSGTVISGWLIPSLSLWLGLS